MKGHEKTRYLQRRAIPHRSRYKVPNLPVDTGYLKRRGEMLPMLRVNAGRISAKQRFGRLMPGDYRRTIPS